REPSHDGGRERRTVVAQQLRAARGGEAGRVEDVLDRERDAREGSGPGAARECPIEPSRLVERPILVEGEKGRELRLESQCSVEVRAHHILGGHLAAGGTAVDLGGAEACGIRHPGRTRGTRKSPSAWSGAWPSASPTDRPSRAAASRSSAAAAPAV